MFVAYTKSSKIKDLQFKVVLIRTSDGIPYFWPTLRINLTLKLY